MLPECEDKELPKMTKDETGQVVKDYVAALDRVKRATADLDRAQAALDRANREAGVFRGKLKDGEAGIYLVGTTVVNVQPGEVQVLEPHVVPAGNR